MDCWIVQFRSHILSKIQDGADYVSVSSPLFKVNPHLAKGRDVTFSVPLLRVLVHSAFVLMLIIQHSAAIRVGTKQ